MKEMMIKFYSDPSHGWGAVKRQTLIDLGIPSVRGRARGRTPRTAARSRSR